MLTIQNLLHSLSLFSLDKDSQILNAIKFAYDTHKDMKRDNGNSYLEEHIYPLTNNVLLHFPSNPNLKLLIIVSLLHDVLEGTDVKKEEIHNQFGEEVYNLVNVLTKTVEEDSNENSDEVKSILNQQYLNRVCQGGHLALTIKLEDRLQNLQSTPIDVALKRRNKYVRYVTETPIQFFPLIDMLKSDIRYKELMDIELIRLRKILEI